MYSLNRFFDFQKGRNMTNNLKEFKQELKSFAKKVKLFLVPTSSDNHVDKMR